MGVRRLVVANGPNIFQMLLVKVFHLTVYVLCLYDFFAYLRACNLQDVPTQRREIVTDMSHIDVSFIGKY